MPKQEHLTPREQANVYYQQGFTWEKSCQMAGFDELADMQSQLQTWIYCMAGLGTLVLIFGRDVVRVLS